VVDLTSLLNAMKTTSSPSQSGGSQAVDGVAKDPQSSFAAILKANVAGKASAQSGNSLPANGKSVPDQVSGDSEEQGVLQNRVLKSGLTLLIGGSEPSDQAISEFAAHQGIDPDTLKLLMDKDIAQQGLADKDAENVLYQSNSKETLQGLSSSLNAFNPDTAESLPDGQNIHNLAAVTSDQQSQLKGSGSSLSDTQKGSFAVTSTMGSSGEQKAPSQNSLITGASQSAGIKKSLGQNVLNSKLSTQSGDVEAERIKAAKSGQPTPGTDLLTANQKELATATNKSAQTVGSKPAEVPMQQTSAIKLMLKVSEDEMRKMPQKDPDRQAPAVKLAPISLLAMQPNVPVPVTEAEHAALQLSASDSVERGLTQELKDSQSQDVMKRRDQYNEISRKLSEALGQRITAQVARGEWRVEMELHPRSLGRIEIQLEMKNGELEANFYTANSATKDLINDSLPRLRLALEQYGMESAYKGLEQGNNGKSDGNPTEHSGREDQLAKGQDPQVDSQKQAKLAPDDGLDILI
jgi:flagellar hook-length control protein FliK